MIIIYSVTFDKKDNNLINHNINYSKIRKIRVVSIDFSTHFQINRIILYIKCSKILIMCILHYYKNMP